MATAVALGAAELAAGALPGIGSLVLAVGDTVIDAAPGWLERAAIAALGTADKPVLVAGVVVLCAVLGALLGVLARERRLAASAGIAAVAAVGVVAALADTRTAAPAAVVVGAFGAAAGVVTLLALLRAAPREARRPPAPVAAGDGVTRRPFLHLVVAAAAVAAAGATAGRWVTSPDRLETIRAALRIPAPARPAPPVPPGADLGLAGVTPLFVANADFYRIDTALTVPRVDPTTWTLEVRGMVDRPFRLTYDELLAMPHLEADITLACVSNPVGGDLVGNARWQGVPLRALLDRAGVRPGATQLLSRSVDGFTAGFPVTTALEVTDAMVAVAMNGEPLPARHGFPARLVVPGLFGYVSATKWLSVIELTTFETEEGYWVPRGWARDGPVLTQSRIDVPRAATRLPPGRQVVAGVAWAPTRGVERVEVRVDDGPWQGARLAAALDVDTWRQWVLEWDATPGRHTLSVRASDGTGETQTARRTAVAPDGARGHHTIEVRVDDA
ncbi:molybdopterin-dependent oxidoreductase [Cellulomonas sp. ATA003]|uniref:molybdopterin-dependent oxidoreductase n=1 Tax=Cellulomonas sp. ATA003 TaxID=3073064 RepID=UPI002873E9B6|nr:molybdopterin-dependent oxidoreductase [Cellulomonas sp. ATA003]WNB84553.1 molybdopterin-dependent oxidoreductase [Cellulomonas sp. ATA003]